MKAPNALIPNVTASECSEVVRALSSVQRATFWRRMYRNDLYGRSRFGERMWEKLVAAQETAQDEADAMMEAHGVKSLDMCPEVMRPDQTVRKANRTAVLAILKEAP